MPRNMSFMLTTEQVRNQTKTVTRRMGWKFLKEGDILNAVEKCQGLKKGEKVKHICQIKVINVRRERLFTISQSEVQLEGFDYMLPMEFVKFFCRSHKYCRPLDFVTRIEFEYL